MSRRPAAWISAAAGLALTVAAAGCGGSAGPGAGSGPAPAAGTCSFAADGDDTGGRTPGVPPAQPSQKSGTATATLVTSVGTVVFTMDAAKTPCTLESFAWLAGRKFFDGTHCHRLTTSGTGISVLQCGDPTGTGSGGPGYTIPDENLIGATYPAGSVAMANTGAPHTGGSQFFLNYQASPLPASYTPFGTITQGLDVLRAVAAAGTADGSPDGAPKTPVTITSFRVGSP